MSRAVQGEPVQSIARDTSLSPLKPSLHPQLIHRTALAPLSWVLACIAHHMTAEARDTSAKRLAPRPDGPLTHFGSPRGEPCRLDIFLLPQGRTGDSQ